MLNFVGGAKTDEKMKKDVVGKMTIWLWNFVFNELDCVTTKKCWFDCLMTSTWKDNLILDRCWFDVDTIKVEFEGCGWLIWSHADWCWQMVDMILCWMGWLVMTLQIQLMINIIW